MEQILTPKQIQEKYSWSYMTWYRRRSDCLVSPFKDAIIIESKRQCRIKAKRFAQFLDWWSEQQYKEQFGLS
ncbi:MULTISPECIES: hypothetical protein [Lactobacillus]|jgi:hypothetical protein|uniref:hypothetical protein n=1 Tax=Lactobacillus TaxID=1578 RepID=UPI00242C85CA|nr:MULTISPECIES: hypothetical protein [Lactobacillus]